MHYREIEPKAAFKVMQSIRRHQWYTTGQTVSLALADTGLEDSEREELAKTLHQTPRVDIKTGRPKFPELDWREHKLSTPKMASLVTSDSWLVFQLLDIEGPND